MNVHRVPAPAVLFSLLLLALCASTPGLAAIDESLPDGPTLARLEQRAQQASPREQCFLYTELVHTLTEMAGRQLVAGDAADASDSLKKVEHYAQLIHLGLGDDPRRLKRAEQLMQHTTFRLHEYSRSASSQDRIVLQTTLRQLDHLEDELLSEVFKH